MTSGEQIRTGESVESGEEVQIAHQVGIKIVSRRVTENTDGPGPFLLCVLEEFGVPSTDTRLVVRIPMKK